MQQMGLCWHIDIRVLARRAMLACRLVCWLELELDRGKLRSSFTRAQHVLGSTSTRGHPSRRRQPPCAAWALARCFYLQLRHCVPSTISVIYELLLGIAHYFVVMFVVSYTAVSIC